MPSFDLSRIDLNLLHTFRVVVDEGGVGRAARVLNRTQPAITSRLHQLEKTLGVQLFERVGRRLALSSVGRAIEARVRAVLSGLQEIVDRARAAAGQPAGILRVGALPTVSAYRLAPVLTRLLADWPELRVEMRHGLTQPQIAALLRGEIDVVCSVGPRPRDPRLTDVVMGRPGPSRCRRGRRRSRSVCRIRP